jgi:hypothetical protein
MKEKEKEEEEAIADSLTKAIVKEVADLSAHDLHHPMTTQEKLEAILQSSDKELIDVVETTITVAYQRKREPGKLIEFPGEGAGKARKGGATA